MKYELKITLDDNSVIYKIPNNVEDNLVSFDKYLLDNKINLKNSLNLEKNIKNIKIVDNKGFEYSALNNNEYLTLIIESVEKGKIQLLDENYERDTFLVNKNNEFFIEMSAYLLNGLNSFGAGFLEKIYKYNNSFSTILNKYINAKANNHTEEDNRNFDMLKKDVVDALSIYKNYRSMCSARYLYENNIHYNRNTTNNAVKVEKKDSAMFGMNVETSETLNRYQTNYVNNLGEEKEEFLDSDEIDESYGTR